MNRNILIVAAAAITVVILVMSYGVSAGDILAKQGIPFLHSEAALLGGDDVPLTVEYEVWRGAREYQSAYGFYVTTSGALVFYGEDMRPLAAYAAGDWKSVKKKKQEASK